MTNKFKTRIVALVFCNGIAVISPSQVLTSMVNLIVWGAIEFVSDRKPKEPQKNSDRKDNQPQ